MSSEALRIAVVGGGPAGLTAGHRLCRSGAEVVVFEEKDHVGGRAWTDEMDGWRVDAGAQLFGSRYTRFLELVSEVGLGGELVRSPGRDALWRGGRAHEVVYGSVMSMLASGGLTWGTKMRLGTTYVPFLTRHSGALDMHAPERISAAGLDTESIAEWGRREIGDSFVEHLVYPQVAAFHGALPEETSAGLYHVLAKQGLDVALYTLRRGSGSLAETLALRVLEMGGEVRTGAAVERVSVGGGAAGVVLEGAGWTETFDAAIVAVPAPVARKIVRGVPPQLHEWLDGVRYRPAVSLALLLRTPVGVPYFGLSFPRDASSIVSAMCVQENRGGELVPDGRGLLVAFGRPDLAGELMRLPAEKILATTIPEVDRVFPGIGREVERARVYRWEHGQPIFHPGYLGRLAAFRGGGIEGDAPLALAGDYLLLPAVEGAVATGRDAADRLLGRLIA
jgi:oxygen-dependent protoporphyrinogen oxidase